MPSTTYGLTQALGTRYITQFQKLLGARRRLNERSSLLFSSPQQKRLGRGQGSGRGGTSTRGHKGQKARSGNGKPKAGFEGGQTPITRRFPKRGFTNMLVAKTSLSVWKTHEAYGYCPHRSAKTFAPVNLDRLQHWIDSNRLLSTPDRPITARELLHSGCVHSVQDGIKLLGDVRYTSKSFMAAQLTSPTPFQGCRASEVARLPGGGQGVAVCYQSYRGERREGGVQVLQRSRAQGLR